MVQRAPEAAAASSRQVDHTEAVTASGLVVAWVVVEAAYNLLSAYVQY